MEEHAEKTGEEPLRVAQVFAAEYEALRPGAGYAGVADAAGLFRKVHADAQPLSALCISGGGIRSATFALGAIQGLAERGLLNRFDYLSTVSGGGYIGSWLTAWSNRVGGVQNVIPALVRGAPPAKPGAPDPIQHLRDYNSYLSPKLGFFSADTWTLAATILRNVALNWLVLIPLLMAALLVPRIYLSVLVVPELLFGDAIFGGGSPNFGAPELDSISGSPAVRYVLPGMSALLFAAALFNTLRFLPGVGNEDHTRADYLRQVLLPLVASVLVYLPYDAFYYLGSTYEVQSSLWDEINGRLLPCALAWIAYLVFCRRPPGTRLQFLPLSSAIFVMAAGTGAAAWVTVNFLVGSPNPDATPSWPVYVTLAPPLLVLGYVLGSVLFVGLSSRFLRDEDREWMSRSAAGLLMFCAAWLLACGLVLIAPQWAVDWKSWAPQLLAAAAVASGWATAFGNALLPKNAQRAGGKSSVPWQAAAMAIKAAPAVFVVALGIALTAATNILLSSARLLPGVRDLPGMSILGYDGSPVAWHNHVSLLSRTDPALAGMLLAVLLALVWITARYININTFSLHGMYRERLVRAYLGASNPKRSAHKFTGFAGDDDVAMHALDPGLKPMHVVNLTLNLVEANRLAWQQRKAQAFTVTPLHCGNYELGYRSAASYGGPGGITLGSAVAISGAAASPSMGYHTSAAGSFIMTLLNARLGCWLGNPGSAGARTWTHAGPRTATGSLVKEAFGLTSNLSAYVYLSDGGHFENLGLYEMVLRRCRQIVVLDGGCDPSFAYEDLGNALRKIRIDLKVPIDFDEASLRALHESKRRYAVASIDYGAVDPGAGKGWLLYVKPMRLGNEPPDVDHYGRVHPDFPHQSTNNQWFDESQTESYRMLGLSTIDDICRGWNAGSLNGLIEHLRRTTAQGEARGA